MSKTHLTGSGIRLGMAARLLPEKVLNPDRLLLFGGIRPEAPVLLVLAAGKGTRFGVAPKCTQPVHGIPLARHSIDCFRRFSASPVVCVVGYRHQEVAAALGTDNIYVRSDNPAGGTAFAAFEALSVPGLCERNPLLIITMGDQIVPPAIFRRLVETQRAGAREADLGLLTAIYEPPKNRGKGRVVRDEGGRVIRIIEQRDIELIAEARVRQPLLDLTEGNCPLYALRAATLRRYASELLNANAQGQFYLTDIVEAISREGGDIRALTTSVADPEYDLLCADVTRPVDLALLEGLLSSAGHLLHSGEAAIAEAARAIAAERPAVQVLSIARQLEELYATAEREKLGFSPTWRIRPTARLFSRRKSLIFRRPIGAHGPKLAVVKTYPIPNPAPMCIMGSRYVFALHHAKEKRQGTPLL